ncbi:MAG: SPOR domain-containing protein [Acidobacteriaceae bacterium]
MATAGVNRMMLWTDLEGREVMGRWRLGRLVSPEGRTAWFEATAANGDALMLSITETLNDDDDLLERLRAAASIHHPNVVEVREALATELDDGPVVIAAMEPTEENLADVLRERVLNVVEAQVVLEALVQGLAAIHARRLVHGRMEPASVLALGETIKLRSDCLLIGGEGFAAAAGENVRGLARIVTQAVTRRVPSSENDAVLQLFPEPMARALRRALSGNAKIEEIAALASVRLVPATVGRPEARAAVMRPVIVAPRSADPVETATLEGVPQGVVQDGSAGTPAAVVPELAAVPEDPLQTCDRVVVAGQSTGPAAATSAAEKAEPRPNAGSAANLSVEKPLEAGPFLLAASELILRREAVRTDVDEEPLQWKDRRSAPWVLGAAAVIVLATVGALFGIFHHGNHARATPSATAATASVTKARSTGAVAPTATRTAVAGISDASSPGWRVVAYTYNHESQADRKTQSLAARYPQLSPGVFQPHGHGPYLVTLGGVMSRTDALAFRERAVRMGLPRDTYAQNYR